MVRSWEFATGATWPDALLVIAGVAVLVAAMSLLARRLCSTWPNGPDAGPIRREMLDECFAKGEMSREECEGRCQGLGHPRGGGGSRPSPDAPTQW